MAADNDPQKRELTSSHKTSVSEEADAKHQSALLDDIREARSAARDSLVVLRQGHSSGVRDPDYQRAVGSLEGFLLTIEPLLLDSQFDKSEYYRDEVDLGKVSLPSHEIHYEGLLNLLPIETIEIEVRQDRSGRVSGSKRTRREQPIPDRILTAAYREAVHFLQENGLGLRMEPGEIDVQADPF